MLPCESEYRQLRGTDDDEEAADVDDLEQADWVNTFFSTAPLPEEVAPSQLGGAPPTTQDSTQGEQTPVPEQALSDPVPRDCAHRIDVRKIPDTHKEGRNQTPTRTRL